MRILVIGNSDGIGLALTKRLLDHGDEVIGVSRRAPNLTSEKLHQHIVDLTMPNAADELRSAIGQSEQIAALIYCAGMGEPFSEVGVALDADTVSVNLTGFAIALAAVLPQMENAKSGRVIALSSIADTWSPGAPSYGATKAGLTTYLLSLRRPLKKLGITASVIRFGFVDTKMAKAPQKPMMMSAEQAVDVILKVLRRGPAITTVPFPMDLLVKLIAFFSYWQARLS